MFDLVAVAEGVRRRPPRRPAAPCQIAPSAVMTIAYRLGLLRWSSLRSSASASRSYGNSGIRQRVDVTYAVYRAVNPASRPKIRNTPIRSWLPSVVRWRLISSFARVIADEKPMQYSVPLTSLSIVLGIADQRHAGASAGPTRTRACRRRRS